MLIADALKHACLIRDRPRRFAECLTGRGHDLSPISLQQIRVEYCRHCGCLFAEGLVMNSRVVPQAVQRAPALKTVDQRNRS